MVIMGEGLNVSNSATAAATGIGHFLRFFYEFKSERNEFKSERRGPF